MLRPLRIVVNLIFYIIEVLLLLRFILKLLNANPASAFTAWIMNASEVFISPFGNIFPNINLGNFMIDFTTVFALVIYIIIAQMILRLLNYLEYPR